jgi:hypothetical protein
MKLPESKLIGFLYFTAEEVNDAWCHKDVIKIYREVPYSFLWLHWVIAVVDVYKFKKTFKKRTISTRYYIGSKDFIQLYAQLKNVEEMIK